MVKALIFDMDGTLINSHDAHVESYREVLSSRGLKVNDFTLAKNFGKVAEDILKAIFPGVTSKEINLMVLEKRRAFLKFIDLVKPLRCAERLLSMGGQFKLVLATSSSRLETNAIISKLGWTEHFILIITSYDVPRPKPSPDILIAAAKKLRLKISDCLFVGDSIFDALSARAAGMSFIGVETGSYSNADFVREGFKSCKNLCSLIRLLS